MLQIIYIAAYSCQFREWEGGRNERQSKKLGASHDINMSGQMHQGYHIIYELKLISH